MTSSAPVLRFAPMWPRLRTVALLAVFPAVYACATEASGIGPDVPDVPAKAIDAGSGATPSTGDPPDPAESTPDASTTLPDPVVFVHGINGGSEDFAVMLDRLVADGWPKDRLSAIDYPDPSWGCNVDNANTLKAHVEAFLAKTGAAKIDLVAHSMGSLSSRKFMRDLGGAAVVNTYVTLGGPHHGVPKACLNPLPVCVWNELCGSKPYLTELNTPPLTPGPAIWVSIFSHDDDTVPSDSSPLEGAENIAFDGVDHDGENGLLERPEVYAEVKRVLLYPPPK